jgi:hypothetical protein
MPTRQCRAAKALVSSEAFYERAKLVFVGCVEGHLSFP